jgi:glycolate oxidase
MEKMEMMPSMFSEDDIEFMTRLRNVFNPASTLNPQKMLPTTRSCRETFTPGHPSVRA